MGANVHPESTGTAVPSRIVANTAQNCDDRVLTRCRPLARRSAAMHLLARTDRAARAAGVRRPAGARWRRRTSGCAECMRALPWLRGGCPRCGLPKHRGRRCPAARAAFPRAWAPMAYQGVARRLVARAEVPRRARGRGPDGGAHRREPPGGAARRRAAVLVPVPGGAGAPARARVRSGARADARARAPARPAARRLPRARGPRGAPGRRGPRASAARRAGSSSTCAARRRRWRSSSTTSTPRARRSTPPPARWRPSGHEGRRGDQLRPHAVNAGGAAGDGAGGFVRPGQGGAVGAGERREESVVGSVGNSPRS